MEPLRNLLVLLAGCVVLTSSGVATADCPERTQRKLRALVFQVNFAINHSAKARVVRMAALRDTAAKLRRAIKQSAGHCSRWYERYGRRALAKAEAKIAFLCPPLAVHHINRFRAPVDDAVRAGDLVRAARAADTLERELDAPLVATCPSIQALRRKTRTHYLVRVRGLVAIPEVAKRAIRAHARVMDPWKAATSVMAKRGRGAQMAPEILDNARDGSRYQERISACLGQATILSKLGQALDARVPGHTLTLRGLRADCLRARQSSQTLRRQVSAHNKRVRAAALKRWRMIHIRGWDQRVVYKRFGKPQAVIVRSGRIIWHYRVSATVCRSHRFDRRGAKQGAASKLRCPASIALR